MREAGDKKFSPALQALSLYLSNRKSAEAPFRLKKLVTGPDGSKTHLVVASPTNDPGPLMKKGFHTGWIKATE